MSRAFFWIQVHGAMSVIIEDGFHLSLCPVCTDTRHKPCMHKLKVKTSDILPSSVHRHKTQTEGNMKLPLNRPKLVMWVT